MNKCDRLHTNFKEKFDRIASVAHTDCLPISGKDSINLEKAILKLRGLVLNETEEETMEKLSKAIKI